jgi:hypothetical protein
MRLLDSNRVDMLWPVSRECMSCLVEETTIIHCIDTAPRRTIVVTGTRDIVMSWVRNRYDKTFITCAADHNLTPCKGGSRTAPALTTGCFR